MLIQGRFWLALGIALFAIGTTMALVARFAFTTTPSPTPGLTPTIIKPTPTSTFAPTPVATSTSMPAALPTATAAPTHTATAPPTGTVGPAATATEAPPATATAAPPGTPSIADSGTGGYLTAPARSEWDTGFWAAALGIMGAGLLAIGYRGLRRSDTATAPWAPVRQGAVVQTATWDTPDHRTIVWGLCGAFGLAAVLLVAFLRGRTRHEPPAR